MRLEIGGRPPIHMPLRGHLVRIGSSPFNDITIPDHSLARNHFEIIEDAGKRLLVDQSGRGLRVNGRLVSEHTFCDGDTIEIDEFSITYLEANSRPGDVATMELGQTGVIAPPRSPNKGRLAWEDENGPQRLDFDEPILIGADPSCHIRLGDEFVSSRHCQLVPDKNGVFLIDLKSTNGTWIDDLRIVEAILPAKCVFRIGKTRFSFEGKAPATQISAPPEEFCGMVGRQLASVQALLRRIAPTDMTILITGETGCGKELAARALHDLSDRSDKPYITVNCAAISAELIESELFGHERGAFTGATGARKGAFEAAKDGTIFLDEIGELPLALQPKLLRTLDSGEIKPVGSNEARYHRARVVAATNRDLAQLVKAGQFREDLYYRLNSVPVTLPPLRERRDDIPLLAEYFLRQAGAAVTLSRGALDTLLYYFWPGNVRELKNALTTTLWYHPEIFDTGVIEEEHVELTGQALARQSDPSQGEAAKKGGFSGQTLQESEAQLISEALLHFNNNKRMVARALGISKSTLYDKLKKYGIG